MVLKRAQYFITCNGKYYGDVDFDEPLIRNKLSPKEDLISENQGQQLNFFDFPVFSSSPAISKVDDPSFISFRTIIGGYYESIFT